MNKNRNSIKNTFSNIHPSDECTERIMNMTKSNKSAKRIKFAPVLAAAVCLAIAVTGIFYGSSVNDNEKITEATANTTPKISTASNFFTITAYAEDGERKAEKKLGDDKVVIQAYKLSRQYGADGILELHGSGNSGFSISGNNIKSVSYKCKTGYIRFGVDFKKIRYLTEKGKYYDTILPYLDEYKNIKSSELWDVFAVHYSNGDYDEYFKEAGKKDLDDYYNVKLVYNDDDTEIIGVGVISNEVYDSVSDKGWLKEHKFINYNNVTKNFAEIYWECSDSETEKILRDENMGYDELSHDTLTITVEFNDGSKQTANYDLGFNKSGNLTVEKLK